MIVSFFFLFDIWCLSEWLTVKDIDFSWFDCYLIHWMIFRHYYVNRNMKDVCTCFFLENNWIKKETNSEDKIVLWNFYPLLGITNNDFVIFTKIQKHFDLWYLFFVFFYLAIDSYVCFNFFDGLKWYKFAFDMVDIFWIKVMILILSSTYFKVAISYLQDFGAESSLSSSYIAFLLSCKI